jgi:hypothetical protein
MPAITIRNVPDDVRDKLAARAARSGRSLQEYLLAELIELTRIPPPEDLFDQVRARKRRTGTRLTAEQILAYRDADRE